MIKKKNEKRKETSFHKQKNAVNFNFLKVHCISQHVHVKSSLNAPREKQNSQEKKDSISLHLKTKETSYQH